MGKFDKRISKKEPAPAKKIKPKKVKDYVFSNYEAEKNRKDSCGRELFLSMSFVRNSKKIYYFYLFFLSELGS